MLAPRLFRILLLLGAALCLGAAHLGAQTAAAVSQREVPKAGTTTVASALALRPAAHMAKGQAPRGLWRHSIRASTPLLSGTLGPFETAVLMERTTAGISGCLCFRLRAF